MANVTNYQKHGWFHGIEQLPDRAKMRLFCGRRAEKVIQDFQTSLNYKDTLARIYYQGLQDGLELGECETKQGGQQC